MSRWTEILTADQIDAQFAQTAALDPRFAREQRKFYETRTAIECGALAHQAWLCCDADAFQIASSFAALKKAQ